MKQNVILCEYRISDLMPPALDQISKRYTVCLLCLHYKFCGFLPKIIFLIKKMTNMFIVPTNYEDCCDKLFCNIGMLVTHHFSFHKTIYL